MAKLDRTFRITKAGKVERRPTAPDASAKQRQKPGGSKKVRVARGRR